MIETHKNEKEETGKITKIHGLNGQNLAMVFNLGDGRRGYRWYLDVVIDSRGTYSERTTSFVTMKEAEQYIKDNFMVVKRMTV